MKKTVAFILSSNYSGSHFLSLLIGSNPKATHLGEVKNLVKTKKKKKKDRESESTRYCHLCGKDQDCQLFKDLSGLNDPSSVYSILFGRVPSSVSLLVDASKKVKWAEQFLGQSEYEVKFIHLIRDPRALVRKWNYVYDNNKLRLKQRIKICKRFPTDMWNLVFSPKWEIYVRKWVFQNLEIFNFLNACGKSSYRLTYRDLSLDTERSLCSLMNWLGCDFQTSQIRYWEHDHHGTQKPGYDWVKNQRNQFIDLRWQEELPEHIQKGIRNHALVNQLLTDLDLSICEKGLRGKISSNSK